MKRWLPIAVLLCLACRPTVAEIACFLDAPKDDPRARRCLTNRAELALRDQYQSLIETRFNPLKPGDVTNVFGPKLSQPPKDNALPIYSWGGVSVSGLGFDPSKIKFHIDWHAIGNLGYLEVFYNLDGESIATMVFYHKIGSGFVPLRYKEPFPKKLGFDNASRTNLANWAKVSFLGTGYQRRLAWDTARFNAIKKWLDEHLPPMTDLGVVEVSASGPVRVRLGTGRDCLIRTQVMTGPRMTDKWLSIDLWIDSPDVKERNDSMAFRSVARPNQSIGFKMDGKFFRLTPQLKREQARDDSTRHNTDL